MQTKNSTLSSLSSWNEEEVEDHLFHSRIPCRLGSSAGFLHLGNYTANRKMQWPEFLDAISRSGFFLLI